MNSLRFHKYIATGNDFVLLDQFSSVKLENCPQLALLLCDRMTGIRADGLIWLSPSPTPSADVLFRFFNPDGSEAETCGNGLRCACLHASRVRVPLGTKLRVGTACGTVLARVLSLSCEILGPSGDFLRFGKGQVEVSMNPPVILSSSVSLSVPRDVSHPEESTEMRFVHVSMGNPHAVCFVEEDVLQKTFPLSVLGPVVENDESFAPQKTNVEFVRFVEGQFFEARVWERGATETLACGSGACAIAVAAAHVGLVERGISVEIRMRGGTLRVCWQTESQGGSVLLEGPCRYVYEGTFWHEQQEEEEGEEGHEEVE